MKGFLWFLAGANVFILKTTHSDQGKFTWVGATLFLTAVTACFTGGFALYSVFNNVPAAVFAGLLWGLFILSIDSMIIATLGQNQSDEKIEEDEFDWSKLGVWIKNNTIKYFPIILRLVISLFIGLVIAKPLEFKIFENEIKEERKIIVLNECQHQERVANFKIIEEFKNNETQIKDDITEIARLDMLTGQYDKAMTMERYGTPGSYTIGSEVITASGKPGGRGKIKTNYSDYEGARLRYITERDTKITNRNAKTARNKDIESILNKAYSKCNDTTYINKQVKATPTILEAYVALDLLSSAEVAAKKDTSSSSSSSDTSNRVNSKSIGMSKLSNVPLENAVLKAKSANTAIWFVTFLIVLIELSPVLLKSMQNPKEYKKRLKEYMTDVEGDSSTKPKKEPLSYIELINKYPFLDPDNSLAGAYKKRKDLYEGLVPELKRINELHAEANSHFTILTDQTATNVQTAKEVNDAVAASMKEKQISVADKLLGIWEEKLNQKINDDPDQFMGDSDGKKQNSQQAEDPSEQDESDAGQPEEPAAYEPAGSNKAEAGDDQQKGSAADADGQEPAGNSADSSSEGTDSKEEPGEAGTESAKEADPEPSEPGPSGSDEPNSEQGSAPDTGGGEPGQGTAPETDQESSDEMPDKDESDKDPQKDKRSDSDEKL